MTSFLDSEFVVLADSLQPVSGMPYKYQQATVHMNEYDVELAFTDYSGLTNGWSVEIKVRNKGGKYIKSDYISGGENVAGLPKAFVLP